MRVEAGHGLVNAFVVKRFRVMIEYSFLVGGDRQRHDLAASGLGKLGVYVDQRLETGDAGSGSGGGADRRRAGFVEDKVVEDGRRLEPRGSSRKLE